MKTMRYRIRLVTLVLVSALLAVLLWCVRSAWLPAAGSSDPAEPSVAPSDLFAADAADFTPVPKGSAPPDTSELPEESPSPGPSSAPDPLFDTFGL